MDNEGNVSSASDMQGPGKVIGVYFSAHWCPPCRGFTPKLAEKYKELRAAGHEFEVIFVSSDRSEEDAASYYADMPWKMLKYSERDIKSSVSQAFNVNGIPFLALLNGEGEVITTDGREAIMECPIDKLADFEAIKKEKERAREEKKTAFKSALSTEPKLQLFGENNIIGKDGNRVSAMAFAGKTIGLYFGAGGHPGCAQFTPKLEAKYNTLNTEEKGLEIIFVSFDRSEDAARDAHATMPWTMLDPADDLKYLLAEVYDLKDLPTLVMLDGNGAMLTDEGSVAIFNTPLAELGDFAAKRRARKEELDRLESACTDVTKPRLSLFGESTIVDNEGNVSSASDMQGPGKVIGVYFSAHWCPPCRGFTPKLAEKYKELRAAGHEFEVIFVSSDRSEEDAASYYADMPWKMLKYSERDIKGLLGRVFDVSGIPSLVLLDGNGVVVTDEGTSAVMTTPFDKLADYSNYKKEAAARMDRFMVSLPDKVAHQCSCGKGTELVKTKGPYRATHGHDFFGCDICGQNGDGWAYHCEQCGDYDVHPSCLSCLDCSEAAIAKAEAALDDELSNQCIE